MQCWKKLKSEKLQTLTKYLMKYGRQENLMTYFSDMQNREWTKDCIFPFLKKGDLHT